MEGKWTICPGPQPDTIFQSQNLLHFLCKCQKNETPSLPSLRRGSNGSHVGTILSGSWRRNWILLLSSLSIPFNPEGKKNPKVCKGPGISAEAGEGEETARETQKRQFTEKCSLSPFGDIFEIKGLWVETPKTRETPHTHPPGSLPENAQVSRHSRRREPRSAGRQFCGFNAVGYSCWFLHDIDSITCVVLVWDVWISVEEKIAMYMSDMITFQTFLGPDVVTVKKPLSAFLF